jgi:hypothetical protein
MAYDNPLETDLNTAETALANNEPSVTESGHLAAKIADLKKLIGEIEAKKKDYKKVAEGISRQVAEFKEYVSRHKAKLKTDLHPKTLATVKQTHDELLDRIKKLDDATKKDAAYAQAEYQKLVTLHATVLKDLNTLKTDADKELAANNLGRMYLLVLFMDDRLKDVESLLDVDAYVTALQNAAREYIRKLDEERKAKAAADAAAAKEKANAKELQDLRSKGRQLALAEIEEGPGKPAVAAGQQGGAQQGQPGGSGGDSSPQPSEQS